jgi:holo-[acyl-carrier protein] synthase
MNMGPLELSRLVLARGVAVTIPPEPFTSQTPGAIPYPGVDAAEVSRIAHAVERWGRRFLDRVYTEGEQQYCGLKMQRLAGRFAAKEAISKVLGTGIRYVHWRDIEILPGPMGKPTVTLYGRADAVATRLGLGPIAISITHTGDLAIAFAVALGQPNLKNRPDLMNRPER